MKKLFVISLCLMTIGKFSTAQNMTITEAINLENPKEKYLFIDCDDISYKSHIAQRIGMNKKYMVISSYDSKTPLVIHDKSILSKDDAAQNCLAGAGTCLLGVLIINVAGKEYNPNYPPSGFIATAGTKYVDGAGAVAVGGFWGTGCFFGIRGIAALFKPKSRPVKSVAGTLTTDDLIKSAALFKGLENKYTINSIDELNSQIIPYILTR